MASKTWKYIMSSTSLFLRQDFLLNFIFYFRNLLLIFQSGTWNLTVFLCYRDLKLTFYLVRKVLSAFMTPIFLWSLGKVSPSWASISFLSILNSEISCSMKSLFHMVTCIFPALSLSFQEVFCFCKPCMVLSLSIPTGSSFSADEYLYGFFLGGVKWGGESA